MLRTAVVAVLVLACAVHPSTQSVVSIRFEGERVTLSARDVPLAVILAEWTRVGGSRFVNMERLTGEPLTLELRHVRERDALAILLRSVSGYISVAAPSEQPAGRSSFDRVILLATSTAVRESPASARMQQLDGQPDPQQFLMQLREVADREAVRRETARTEALMRGSAEPIGVHPASRSGQQTATPADPFGNVPGSVRPGEIAPLPQHETPQNQPPRNSVPAS